MNVSKEYDRLYEEGVKLFRKYDPCKIKDGACISRNRDFCCGYCRHLGPNGCRVKSLACKLWLCPGLIRKQPIEFTRARNELYRQAYELGVHHIRCGKAESIFRRKESISFERRHGWYNM